MSYTLTAKFTLKYNIGAGSIGATGNSPQYLGSYWHEGIVLPHDYFGLN